MHFPFARTAVTLGAAAFICTCLGCARSFYRKSADRDVYSAITQKELALNMESDLPEAQYHASPESRFFDPLIPTTRRCRRMTRSRTS